MRHFRVALFDVISGTAEEVIEIARAGLVPIFETQPGFVRYEVGVLDDGGILSFSIWETADEAQRAVDLAADFVKDNLANRERLRDQHTGDVAWDDPA
jgi:heme-degrading monooxygenase HmoA